IAMPPELSNGRRTTRCRTSPSPYTFPMFASSTSSRDAITTWTSKSSRRTTAAPTPHRGRAVDSPATPVAERAAGDWAASPRSSYDAARGAATLEHRRADRRPHAGDCRLSLHGAPGAGPRDGHAAQPRLRRTAVLRLRRDRPRPEDARLPRPARLASPGNTDRSRPTAPWAGVPRAKQTAVRRARRDRQPASQADVDRPHGRTP